MKRFLIAFLIGLFAPIAVIAVLVERGSLPFQATAEPTTLEAAILRRAAHNDVARRAGGLANPETVTDETLLAGLKIFQNGCAGCHGDGGHPSHWGTHNFYPRVPQFAETPSELSAPEMFVVVKHGIRYSGMAGWDGLMPDADIWRVVTFLSQLRSLPPDVAAAWRSK